jgi:hypothetical protein
MVVGRTQLLILALALAGAFLSCGGSSDGGDGGDNGNGGSGGTAPNTCPPTLVNYGSGPGIICNEPVGSTCSDTEQFCVCGEMTIEGSPWICVPTEEGCPATFPAGEACDASAAETCEYLDDQRMTCTCIEGAWQCEQSPCVGLYPSTGAPCTLDAGDTCRYFLPAYPDDPDNARNVTCTCTAEQTWSCPGL